MVFNNEMIDNKSFFAFFIDGLRESIRKMTGFIIEEEELIHNDKLCIEVGGGMILVGQKKSLLIISSNKATAGILISYLTGTEFDEVEESQIASGMSELVNMTAGLAKTSLADTARAFSLAPPFAVIGNNIKFIVDDYVEKYETILASSEVLLKIGLYYF